MSAPLLEIRQVCKSYPGVQALAGVDLTVEAGTIHALVGENGAGKSTLIKIISGLVPADAGQMLWLGAPLHLNSSLDAQRVGIATIHQELTGFPTLTVAENLLLGERWPRRAGLMVDWGRLHAEAQGRLARFGLELRTTATLDHLSAAQRQELAIVRAISRRSRLLILDEPTASLTEPEVARLKQHLGRLREEGTAILYISHRLDEVLQISDCVTVLRDGARVAHQPTRELTTDQLVRQMVGRPIGQFYAREHRSAGGPCLLRLDRLTRQGMFDDVSLHVDAGEVVGLGGLVGAGRSELARAIYGLYPADSGTMTLRGAPYAPRSPREALVLGLAYLPEERKRQALALDQTLTDSIGIGISDLMTRWGVIDGRRVADYVRSAIAAYRIRATGPEQPVGTMSGGNQQKALLARVLGRNPTLVVLDEPTRGVDVGAKADVHALVDRLSSAGQGVLMISSDLPELLAMSDRLYVMHEGRMTAELQGASLNEEQFMRAASGLPSVAVDGPAVRRRPGV